MRSYHTIINAPPTPLTYRESGIRGRLRTVTLSVNALESELPFVPFAPSLGSASLGSETKLVSFAFFESGVRAEKFVARIERPAPAGEFRL